MAILFVAGAALFYSVSLPPLGELAGIPETDWRIIAGCLLVVLAAGWPAEMGVLFWRFRSAPEGRFRFLLGALTVNLLAAILVGVPVFALLHSPLLNPLRFKYVLAIALGLELFGVALTASDFLPRLGRKTLATRTISGRQAAAANVMSNLASMLAGVGAGRLFLGVFLPETG